MDGVIGFISDFSNHVLDIVTPFDDPKNRLFGLYLLTSLGAAFLVYLSMKSSGRLTETSFVRFIFPKHVWTHKTAWLDLRYFLFHMSVGHFFINLLTGGVFVAVMSMVVGAEFGTGSGSEPLTGLSGMIIILAFMLIGALVADFAGFILHYAQHKVPLLWHFHKVHHCGEVMHPLSNFREHPIDNFVYKSLIAASSGLVLGVFVLTVGYVPSTPTILGATVLAFLFNAVGYHLRHSHIWLKWPGVWSKIFASPAHHHVHHSRHPDHLDKNFAFMFPFWDVLFGTYVMPEDNRDVEFGIVEDASEMDTCLKLYFIPFRDAWRHLKHGPTKKGGLTTQTTPSQDQAPILLDEGL